MGPIRLPRRGAPGKCGVEKPGQGAFKRESERENANSKKASHVGPCVSRGRTFQLGSQVKGVASGGCQPGAAAEKQLHGDKVFSRRAGGAAEQAGSWPRTGAGTGTAGTAGAPAGSWQSRWPARRACRPAPDVGGPGSPERVERRCAQCGGGRTGNTRRRSPPGMQGRDHGGPRAPSELRQPQIQGEGRRSRRQQARTA